MAYKKDVDYTSMIQQASQAGDFAQAAALEATRNEKINGEGMDYGQTQDFSGFLGKEEYKPVGDTTAGGTDWSTTLGNLMKSGADASQVGAANQSRVNKATSTPGLGQYAYDDVYNQAQQYIAQNKQADQFNTLLSQITDKQPFEYDAQSDPSYQAYATQFTNQGKQAMQDTMGEFAGMTGGLPSSAAMSAAGQANNQYMSQMSGMIPQLEQQAYQRDQDAFSNDMNALGVMQGERAYTDSRIDANSAKAQQLLAMGLSNAEVAQQLGITEQQAAQYAGMVTSGMMADIAKVNRTNTDRSSGGSSGSGGNGGKGTITEMYQAMEDSGDPSTYLSRNYKKFGIPAGQINNTVAAYKVWAKNQAKDTNDTSGEENSGRNWTVVSGYGRLSYDEVETMVDKGELLEEERGDGECRYRKNPNYKK